MVEFKHCLHDSEEVPAAIRDASLARLAEIRRRLPLDGRSAERRYLDLVDAGGDKGLRQLLALNHHIDLALRDLFRERLDEGGLWPLTGEERLAYADALWAGEYNLRPYLGRKQLFNRERLLFADHAAELFSGRKLGFGDLLSLPGLSSLNVGAGEGISDLSVSGAGMFSPKRLLDLPSLLEAAIGQERFYYRDRREGEIEPGLVMERSLHKGFISQGHGILLLTSRRLYFIHNRDERSFVQDLGAINDAYLRDGHVLQLETPGRREIGFHFVVSLPFTLAFLLELFGNCPAEGRGEGGRREGGREELPRDSAAALDAAEAALAKGDYETLRRRLAEAAESPDPRLPLLAGHLAYRDGDYPVALERYRAASEAGGARQGEAEEYLGWCRQRLGELEAAREHWRRAHGLGRRGDALLASLGRAALGAGEYEEAAECYRQRFRQSPQDADAAYELAYAEFKRGAADAAAEAAERAIELRPGHPQARQLLDFLAGQGR